MMKKPKILFYDIETSLAVVGTFSLFNEAINYNNILADPFIICASFKELGKKGITTVKMTGEEALKGDDSRVVKKIHNMIRGADIIVAHNGDKFDLKWIKGRGLKYGLSPLNHTTTIDTLKVSRKNFRLLSNRLDYLGEYLGVGRKMATPNGLWLGVLKGDKKAIDIMANYNKQDVVILEKVYLKLLPYIENHPVMGDRGSCVTCGSQNLINYGTIIGARARYKKLQCTDCGHVQKGKKL
jgi:DNA polymerase elongation subunit (family B)